MFIPCMNCRQEFGKEWHWFVCNTCGYRICHPCLAQIGHKCNQCAFGYFESK